MSKKKIVLILVSLVFTYIVYSNTYLIKMGFNYLTRPKTILTDEEDIGLGTETSLEDFLLKEEEKRKSKLAPKEEEPLNNEEDKNPILSLVKKEKEEPDLGKNPGQVDGTSPTLEEIQEKYTSDFKKLESSFKANIDSLIASALIDYQAGALSKRDIAKKYLDQGKGLEEKSDKEFYKVLDQMKKELKSNKLPLDITNDIKTYYETYKVSEKNKLVEKGMSIVKKD